MATLQQIQEKVMKLQAQAEAIIATESQAAIKKIRDLMSSHNLTVADIDAYLGGEKRGRKSVAKSIEDASSTIKYRDPKTGATWSGRGRAPGWMASAKNRDQFLVQGEVASAASRATKPKTVGNYVRGPQPAMYRDPKSGATWSGRGRAPAWLASQKDRNKFLIAEAAGDVDAAAGSESTANVTARKVKVAVKKAAAKKGKVAAKKVILKKAPSKTAGLKVARKKSAAKSAAAPAKKVGAKKTVSRKAASKKAAVAAPKIEASQVPAPTENVASESTE